MTHTHRSTRRTAPPAFFERALAAAGLAAAMATAATFPAPARAQSLPTTPVAVTGQSAPGTGAQYLHFGTSSINRSGQVAFHSWLAGDGVTELSDSAAFVATAPGGAGIRLLTREGQPAPVPETGVTLGELFLAGGPLTPAGQSMVNAELRSGGARSGYAILAGTPDDLRLVYRPAFNETVLGQPVLNNGPRALLWKQAGPHLVVWDGTSATPVETPGEIFQPTINGPGRIAFTAYNVDGGPPGLYAGTPGDFRPVAVYGAPAPGLPEGYTFDVVLNASQNNAGQLAFLGPARSEEPESYGWGLWAGQPGDLRLLARDGQAAPGLPAGYQFDRILWDIDSPTTPALGGAGHVPFWATYRRADAPAGTDAGSGVWLARAGEPTRLIARSGDALPASLPGVPEGLSMSYFPHNDQWVNAAGQLVFMADSAPEGGAGQREALLAAGPDGTLRLIALQGAPFEVTPGQFRNVSDILVGIGQGTGGEDGRYSPFNAAGQLVYRLDFTDGTSGIFLTTVPDPAAAAPFVAVSALAALLRPRRRRPTGAAVHGRPAGPAEALSKSGTGSPARSFR